jgi:hypothetical protein
MRRLRATGPVADVVVVLGTFLVLGAVCGLLWFVLVHPAHLERVRGGFQAPSELDLAKRIAADGWYVVIASVAGFAAGLGLTWWRSRDFLLTTVMLLPGAALAAAVMTLVGHALGPADPHQVLATASPGQMAPLELTVTAKASYLTWPVAVLLGSLMVLWSSPRAPGHEGRAVAPEDGPAAEVPASRGLR